jgi:cytochrome c553
MRRLPLRSTLTLGMVAVALASGWKGPVGAAHAQASAVTSAEGVAFFEKKIRPVLVTECYECHSSGKGKKTRGGLALDTRDGVRKGGDTGPAIVPGSPEKSLLIKALSHANPKLAMPPRKKLGPEVVRDFEEWARMGAPDPRDGTRPVHAYPTIEEGRKHWAFRPVKKAAPPAVKDASWPRTDLDRYILAALDARGLKPVGMAERMDLLRRASFDLTGLPPTQAEAQAFAADSSAEAFEKAVVRLLDSPRFGEKWARHWLDVARFAESTGKTVNFAYPHAWRYRDYVIAAFNADKPYDLFIKEQLAGDLMKSETPRDRAERLIATGFLAIGPKTLNDRSGLRFELDIADEQVDVVTQAFLGITAACARCHDHKFDPIPQKDYYALAGIFRSTETCYGTVRYINAQRPGPLLTLPSKSGVPAGVPRLSSSARQRVESQIKTVKSSMSSAKDGLQRFFATGQLSLLQARLDAFEEDGAPKLLAMGARDKPARPEPGRPREGFPGYTNDGSRAIGDSPLYNRGEPDQPSAERIPRGGLQVLGSASLKVRATSSGRLELAEWIASKECPLTARVMVNRVWMHLFGRGLVPTADDFGLAGRPPSHPELLDHLALRFMEDGWSVKRLIRHLVLSRVYQLSSQVNKEAMAADPENTLLWRMSPRRLDAESLRDTLLAVSGQLTTTSPEGSAVALAGEGPISRPRAGGESLASAVNDPRNTHRSIYLPVIRDIPTEALSLFDGADPSLITSVRVRTTVPSQGLYLLNNAFVLRAADATADLVMKSKASEADRVADAFQRVYGRAPTSTEQSGALKFLKDYRAQMAREGATSTRQERESWSAFCQALLASAELQYRK